MTKLNTTTVKNLTDKQIDEAISDSIKKNISCKILRWLLTEYNLTELLNEVDDLNRENDFAMMVLFHEKAVRRYSELKGGDRSGFRRDIEQDYK